MALRMLHDVLLSTLVPSELLIGGGNNGTVFDAPGVFDTEPSPGLYSPIVGRGCSVWTCLNCLGSFMALEPQPTLSPIRVTGADPGMLPARVGGRFCSKTCRASAQLSGVRDA